MSTQLSSFNITLPLGSLDAYIAMADSMPLLSREEELALAERYFNSQAIDAARQLVMTHLRYVVRIARKFKGYGLALGDLIQEGNIGLMKAVKRFNPAIGVRLVSFAVHWIKAEMQEFILRNWRIVKVATTKAKRKLFFNLRKKQRALNLQDHQWLNQAEVEQVSTELRVKQSTVREMEARLSAHDMSFDLPNDEDDNHNSVASNSPVLYLADNRYDPARLAEATNSADLNHAGLQEALLMLDARAQHIITQRWLTEPKATLHDLAKHYKVSAERIRQLEVSAMKQLRVAIEQVA